MRRSSSAVDVTVLTAAELLWWQNEALFIPALEARTASMIAASAPMKEQSDADLRARALEDLIRENDAFFAGFDVEAFDTLRRTPTDLAWVD